MAACRIGTSVTAQAAFPSIQHFVYSVSDNTARLSWDGALTVWTSVVLCRSFHKAARRCRSFHSMDKVIGSPLHDDPPGPHEVRLWLFP
eukprot:scaffold203088_cov17-Tisochrysis_lutea.AAC.1